MAERVLSIEIGYSLTKVVEVENNGKQHKIFNSFVIPTSEGMLRDGAPEVATEFVNDFKKNVAQRGIKTKKVIFTVASSKIAAREAVIPFVKEKQIKDIVRANLSDYFPVDLNQYMFSHSVIGMVYDNAQAAASIEDKKEEREIDTGEVKSAKEESAKKAKPAKAAPIAKPTGYKLLILAAPKPLIFSYNSLAKALDLEVVSIDYNGNSIYQAAKDECQEGVRLIIKVDEKSSLIMITEDGNIALNRTIPYGIEESVSTLIDTRSFGEINTYEEALEIARRKTVILSSFDDGMMAVDSPEESVDPVREDKKRITQSFRTLAGGILRVIDYYNSNHSNRPVDAGFITGVGADFSGLQTLLSNELGMKIKNLTHLAGIDIEKVFKDVSYGEYVTVIGATIAPLDFYPDHDEAKKSGSKGGSTSSSGIDDATGLVIAIVVLLVCIIASAVAFFMFWIPYNKELKLKEGYENTIAQCEPAIETYKEYLQIKADNDYLVSMDEAARDRNNEILDFIDYLERNMPYSFCLNSIESDEEKMTLDATVVSKEEAASVVDKLSLCETFSSAEMTSISLIENELGEYLYEFSIDLFFAPYESAEDEAQEEDV